MPTIKPRYPSLYQINTRIWLQSLSAKVDLNITLDQVPDEELDRIAALGFDWIWLLGVWRISPLGREIASQLPELRQEYEGVLPGYEEKDICSSPFAITGYTVNPDLGGDRALANLLTRLHERGLRLMLDFIPNHTARDHPWLTLHPDFYIQGIEEDLLGQPFNFGTAPHGDRIFAFGRDPYFPGWSDTFQLNYGNPQLQIAMGNELGNIAALCDGVRCDMAMLVLPEVFFQTWDIKMKPFWPQAIQNIRAKDPDFLFLAEVYWDLEATLQEQGFDFTYDKHLYDRLHAQEARPVREHLFANLDFQSKSARFMENHDEPRAAKTFPLQVHQAAALITYLTPGMRFFHQGQFAGNKARIPMQLCRAPAEPDDPKILDYYLRLLDILKLPILRTGEWRLLECHPAWQSNWTWDSYLAFSWEDENNEHILVMVNYAPHQSQCYVRLPWQGLSGKQVCFRDIFGDAVYLRSWDDISKVGLYLDLPAWDFHVFEVTIT
jgi:hypothetical protein